MNLTIGAFSLVHGKGYTAVIVLKIKGAIIQILGGQDLWTLALTLLFLLFMESVVYSF